MSGPRRAIVAALALMTVPALVALVAFAGRPATSQPWLAPAKAGTTCLLPQATARYAHGSELRRLRDQVVRDGIRDTAGANGKVMASCRGCHSQRDRFCDRCHLRASVQLDCFGCHAF